MTTKLLLMAATVTFSLFLGANETQAQGRRNNTNGWSNRGVNARVYGRPSNQGTVYSTRSNNFRTYTPYNNSAYYGNYSRYGYPSGYGSVNGFRTNLQYGYPSGYGSGGIIENYGYRPSGGLSWGNANSRFGNYRYYAY